MKRRYNLQRPNTRDSQLFAQLEQEIRSYLQDFPEVDLGAGEYQDGFWVMRVRVVDQSRDRKYAIISMSPGELTKVDLDGEFFAVELTASEIACQKETARDLAHMAVQYLHGDGAKGTRRGLFGRKKQWIELQQVDGSLMRFYEHD